jgi:NhaP-type Na+/H+ and K+/H+ antiporter
MRRVLHLVQHNPLTCSWVGFIGAASIVLRVFG